jgi:hypothetical protein
MVVLSPNCPELFLPQVNNLPSLLIAAECDDPPAILLKIGAMPNLP